MSKLFGEGNPYLLIKSIIKRSIRLGELNFNANVSYLIKKSGYSETIIRYVIRHISFIYLIYINFSDICQIEIV